MSTRFLKQMVAARMPGKIFVVGILTGLVVISAAWGQTAPAKPAGQVGPGTTAIIGPGQGVGGAPVDAPHKTLNNALRPETPQTRKDAMNSFGAAAPAGNPVAAGEVILGPGEAEQLDGATVGRIAFSALPDQVKGALGAPVHDTLSTSQGR